MTFRFAAILTADGRAAKQGIAEVSREAEGLRDDLQRVDAQGKRTATSLDRMGDEARDAARGFDTAAAAGNRAAQGARGVQQSHQLAAGSVGNLTAQFNDIGVMMAAGQNPLQMALQQGTQITQVFGNQGAGAAVRGLGAALVSLVSPLNLITIGSIAAGGYLVQAFLDAGEEAESFDDRMDELVSRIDRYAEVADLARMPTEALRDRFGEGADAARRFYEELEAIERSRLLGGGVSDLIGGLIPGFGGDSVTQRTDIRDRFGLRSGPRDRRLVAGQMGLEEDLRQAETLEAQIAATERLLENSRALARERGGITSIEEEYIRQLAEAGARLVEMREEVEGLGAAETARLAELSAIYGLYADTRAESDAALITAEAELAALARKAEIAEAVARFGAESLQVAELRVAAERDVYQAQVDAREVSEAMKAELMAAWDAANGVASVDMAGNISLAANEAGRLASNLARAIALAPITPAMRDEDAAMSQSVLPDASDRAGQRRAVDNYERILRGTSGGGRGSRGGGGSVRAQESALERLNEKLNDELAILRETDPIQKELLRNREALADASSGERAAIEDLIRSRHEEEAAIGRAQEKYDLFRDSGFDLITGMAESGDAAVDAVNRVAEALADAAWQGMLLGEGPFGDILGGASTGGLLGQVFSAVFPGAAAKVPANAEGGMYYSPGDSRSDGGLSWLSSGEFIVNAGATARHRALLEAINAGGDIPRFARGGFAGGGRPDPSSVPSIQIINQTNGRIEESYEEDRGPDGQRRIRFVLSEQVGDAMEMPGGRARKALRRGYNLQPNRPLR